MVQTCFINGCMSRSISVRKCSFFRFPKNQKEAKEWHTQINRYTQQCSVPSKHSRICENHFEQDDMKRDGLRTILKDGAIPKIFQNFCSSEENMEVEYLESENDECMDYDDVVDNVEQLQSSTNVCECENVDANVDVCQDSVYCNSGSVSPSFSSKHDSASSQCNVVGTILLEESFSTESRVSIEKSVDQGQCDADDEKFQTPKRGRKRRLCYPGDVRDGEDLTPRSSKKFIRNLKMTVSKQRIKLRNLNKKNLRAAQRIATLKSLIQDLKRKNLVTENSLESLKLHDDSLMRKIKIGKVNNQFPADVRSFALTLNFYSPRAYRYVRKTFAKKLPAPRTIRKWYESIDADPGITTEAIAAIALKIDDSKKKGIDLRFCMSMDEMSIRKQVEYSHSKKKYYGYVDFGGTGIDREGSTVATKALVLMLTAINAHFKIPVAYFLTHGLGSEEQASVVDKVLRTLTEKSISVTALVFDGAATNISMINVLNRNGKTSSYFHHPLTKEMIYIIWDACHMIKLVRNTLADKKILYDAQGRAIEWKYIEMLQELQDVNRIRMGNRLTKQHVLFRGKKMNVRLAVQTLSRSVADALDVLRETNPAFKNCGPTVEFIRTFDRLFDICNSKSKYGKYFKRPICPESEKEIFDFFASAKSYIEGLKLHSKKIIKTKSFTGFFGFIQTMKSIRQIYDANVKNGSMDYLLTYKLSQDHIETFFGCVRSRGGFNNNPNALQFCSAYKQLMTHNEIKCPSQSNCLASENISMLTVSSARSKILQSPDEDDNVGSSTLSQDYKGMVVSYALGDFVSESVVYIAGFVERSIRRKLNCEGCMNALNCGNKASGALLNKKNYGQFGGLCYPTWDVVVLCRIAEKNLQTVEKENRLSEAQMYLRLLNKCLRDVPSKLLNNMDDHIKECSPLENHRYLLIKSILEEYLRVKLFHIGKLQTIALHRKFVRATNTKVTLFAGQ